MYCTAIMSDSCNIGFVLLPLSIILLAVAIHSMSMDCLEEWACWKLGVERLLSSCLYRNVRGPCVVQWKTGSEQRLN